MLSAVQNKSQKCPGINPGTVNNKAVLKFQTGTLTEICTPNVTIGGHEVITSMIPSTGTAMQIENIRLQNVILYSLMSYKI